MRELLLSGAIKEIAKMEVENIISIKYTLLIYKLIGFLLNTYLYITFYSSR